MGLESRDPGLSCCAAPIGSLFTVYTSGYGGNPGQGSRNKSSEARPHQLTPRFGWYSMNEPNGGPGGGVSPRFDPRLMKPEVGKSSGFHPFFPHSFPREGKAFLC